MSSEVANFARWLLAGLQSRKLFLSLRFVFTRFSQHFRLPRPHTNVAGTLNDKRLVTIAQRIQERGVLSIEFIRRPAHDADAVGQRAIDLIDRDLWLRAEFDFVGDEMFFRRAESFAHSSGRYNCVSSSTLKPGAEHDNATVLTPFSILPRLPLYCRLTPAV